MWYVYIKTRGKAYEQDLPFETLHDAQKFCARNGQFLQNWRIVSPDGETIARKWY